MPEFRRVRKKNADIQSVDRSGITRIKGGWLIRLGWSKRRPQFQKVIRDRDFRGNQIESYLEAVSIARELRPNYKSDFKQPTNLIKGLCLARQKSKSKGQDGKAMYYYCWKYSYFEKRKQKGRTFGFWKNGRIYESFLEAVGFAIQVDSATNLERIDQYFTDYLRSIDSDTFQYFLQSSDIHVLGSPSDLFILKNRYLRPVDRLRLYPFKSTSESPSPNPLLH